MTLSPQRKKEIQDEETRNFNSKKETEEELAYREQVRKKLAKGTLVEQVGKILKDAIG